MNIAIIGSGNMAKALSTRLLGGGHKVSLYCRHTEHGQQAAKQLSTSTKPTIKPVSESIVEDIVIPAVPYKELVNALSPHKTELAGKVIIEISNPVDFATFEIIAPEGSSAAEEVAKMVPVAKVAKAFNTTSAVTLVEGQVANIPLDVFIASDDQKAKQTVTQLVKDGGLRALDSGPLKRARALEAFQLIHMTLQEKLGTNFKSAIKIIS